MADDINNAKTTADIDRFLWKRVWMIFQLYYPGLKKQIIAIPIFVFVATLIGVIYYNLDYTVEQSLWIPLIASGFLVYFAPLGLAHRNYISLTSTLPVKASEKFVFLILYFSIFINLLINLSTFISVVIVYSNIANGISTFMSLIQGIDTEIGRISTIYGAPTSFALTTIMILVIVSSRKNRQAKALIAFIVSSILLMFISGVVGLIIGICHAMGWIPNPVSDDIVTYTPFFSIMISVILFMISLITSYLLYRKLKTSGF